MLETLETDRSSFNSVLDSQLSINLVTRCIFDCNNISLKCTFDCNLSSKYIFDCNLSSKCTVDCNLSLQVHI